MQASTHGSVPLIYVFKGKTLPKYSFSSIMGAIKRSGVEVILLTDATNTKMLDSRIKVVEINTFYNEAKFIDFKSRTPLDKGFRHGFWLVTAERLFILEQFVKNEGIKSFFHAELDVMISKIDHLPALFDLENESIFIPRDAVDRAIASLVYVNSVEAFSKLVDFCIENSHVGNEMKILAFFMDTFPDLCIALPTASIYSYENMHLEKWKTLDYKNVDGFFDAAGIGQWLFGVDSKNVTGLNFNHFKNETWEGEPEKLKVSITSEGMRIVHLNKKFDEVNLYCLHIHSKINEAIESNYGQKILKANNRGKKSLISSNFSSIPMKYLNRVWNKIRAN